MHCGILVLGGGSAVCRIFALLGVGDEKLLQGASGEFRTEGSRMRWARILILAWVACGLVSSVAMAQRGVGGPDGIARKAVLPEVVTLKGTVVKVETGPCENTTGRSIVGTHFLMKDPKGKTLNMHLGPTAIVEFVAKELTDGKTVKVEAFRTEQMKKNHYVACTITCDGRAVTLRDATLRPAWAGGREAADGRSWSTSRSGRGLGPGWGRGRNQGRGQGWSRQQGGSRYRATSGECPRFGAWYPVQEAKSDTE